MCMCMHVCTSARVCMCVCLGANSQYSCSIKVIGQIICSFLNYSFYFIDKKC